MKKTTKNLTKKLIIMLMTAMLVLGTATVAFAADDTAQVTTKEATIQDNETPLAAAEDKCTVHWLVLILTAGVVGYYAIRIVAESKAAESEITKQEA